MATIQEQYQESMRLHREKAEIYEQQNQMNEQARQQMLSDAETSRGQMQQQVGDWLANRKIGFGIQDALMDHRDMPVTLRPRFSTLAEAEAFRFSSAEDYSPDGCFHDMYRRMPSGGWFSEPYPAQFTGKHSVYADIGVGNSPHPNPKPKTRIAVLAPYQGAPNPWLLSGVEHDYSKPRFLSHSTSPEWKNGEIHGQHWGGSYDDFLALVENQPGVLGVGHQFIRIINLGPEIIHVKGLWAITHGMMEESE